MEPTVALRCVTDYRMIVIVIVFDASKPDVIMRYFYKNKLIAYDEVS